MKDDPVTREETDLVRRCARGDGAAYRELVGRLEKPLLTFIQKYVGDPSLAEDLFQETFVRVVRSLGDFRPEASVTTWIFTIARNLCLDHLKAKRRHREVSIDAGSGGEGGNVIDFREALRTLGPGPGPQVEAREEEAKLRRAIRELGGAKREALILRVFSGLSYQVIAQITEAPVGTVKFRVHEAVQELARKLAPAAGKDQTGTES